MVLKQNMVLPDIKVLPADVVRRSALGPPYDGVGHERMRGLIGLCNCNSEFVKSSVDFNTQHLPRIPMVGILSRSIFVVDHGTHCVLSKPS